MNTSNILRRIAFFGFVLIATPLALQLFDKMDARLGPLRLELGMRWTARGETRIMLPPMGEVVALTHRLPVSLSIRLDRLEPELLHMDFSPYGKTADYIQALLPGFHRLIVRFILKTLLLGAAAGGVTGLVAWGWRDWPRWGLSLLLGLSLTGVLVGAVAAEFNPEAFKNSRYEGMLEAAPWLLDLLDEGVSRIDVLSKRLETVAGNLNRVFNQVDRLGPLAGADGEFKVVHVSDIHNNPAAFGFLARVARGFGADLVVDTGDITDFGTPLEAQLADGLAELKVPYFFIPGNHDSPEAIARLKRLPRLRVLDGRAVTYKGLTILGLGDPAGKSGRLMAAPEELRQSAEELSALWQKTPSPPDLVAVHNVKTASKLLGKIPVLLHGHDHQAKIYEEGKTWVIDAGSTGAAGIRGLAGEIKEGDPYSLALLRYGRAPAGSGRAYKLTAVDLIRVYGLNGRFVLERKVLKDGNEDQTLSGGLAVPRSAGRRDGVHQSAEAR